MYACEFLVLLFHPIGIVLDECLEGFFTVEVKEKQVAININRKNITPLQNKFFENIC